MESVSRQINHACLAVNMSFQKFTCHRDKNAKRKYVQNTNLLEEDGYGHKMSWRIVDLIDNITKVVYYKLIFNKFPCRNNKTKNNPNNKDQKLQLKSLDQPIYHKRIAQRLRKFPKFKKVEELELKPSYLNRKEKRHKKLNNQQLFKELGRANFLIYQRNSIKASNNNRKIAQKMKQTKNKSISLMLNKLQVK